MPAKKIDDGYTLPFATLPYVCDAAGNFVYEGLPVVTGTYRPPTYRQLNTYRFDYNRAKTADEEVKLTTEFIAARLVSWDMQDADGKPVPVDEHVAAFLSDGAGEPHVSQLIGLVAKWGPNPASQADAAKN